jgi:hypothetical protein
MHFDQNISISGCLASCLVIPARCWILQDPAAAAAHLLLVPRITEHVFVTSVVQGNMCTNI